MDLFLIELNSDISARLESHCDNSVVFVKGQREIILIDQDAKRISLQAFRGKKLVHFAAIDLSKENTQSQAYAPSGPLAYNSFDGPVHGDGTNSLIYPKTRSCCKEHFHVAILTGILVYMGRTMEILFRMAIKLLYMLVDKGYDIFRAEYVDTSAPIDTLFPLQMPVVYDEYFSLFRISTWPKIHKSLVNVDDYLNRKLERSFMSNLIAYMTSFNDQIYVKELQTQEIIKERVHPGTKLILHLLYKTGAYKSFIAKKLMRYLTFSAGVRLDSPYSTVAIQNFVRFFDINMDECEKQTFGSFNEFFYRKLKPGARVVQDPGKLCSPADSRLLYMENNRVLAKGTSFEVRELVQRDMDLKNTCVFRLAPQDYHRFHSPVKGEVKSIKYVNGDYYSVSPINHKKKLLEQNMRCIIELGTEKGTVFFVAIGATLVGSIVILVKEGDKLDQMDEVGYFKFGGSCICLIFDYDWEVLSEIKGNSLARIETLIKVGNTIES